MPIVLGEFQRQKIPPMEEVTSLSHRLQGALPRERINSALRIGQTTPSGLES
jgi:hypothetical protein